MTDAMMVMLLKSNSFVGNAEKMEKVISPLPNQLDFGPSSTALVAMANTMLENEFTVVRGLDPMDYADEFPDWEDRMKMEDHVLCESFSRSDPDITIGWYHRLKLIPIPVYRYKECRSWRKNGYPDDLPPWVQKALRAYSDALSERAPDKVPHSATCPKCGGRNVNLVVVRRIVYTARAGQVELEGEDRFLPLVEPEQDSHHTAQLRCTDCEATGDLDDDEWHMPGISN